MKAPSLKNTALIKLKDSHKTHQSGFTLIELLTVIAIIAILAAILIPAIGSVRMNAQKAKTTSDLRQVFAAMTLYSTENQGTLPGPAFSGISAGFRANNRSLPRYLAPYLTATPDPDDTTISIVEELLPSTYKDLAGTYSSRGTVYITNKYYTSSDNPDEPFAEPFGYPPSGSDPARQPKKLLQIPDPARNVAFYGLDKQNVDGSPGWVDSLAVSPFFDQDRPFLYWDGHIVMKEDNSPEAGIEDRM
ncbi:MAG: type II secretion system protein [Lentimonas sp.]